MKPYHVKNYLLCIALFSLSLDGCEAVQAIDAKPVNANQNEAGWQKLIDGNSLEGWHSFKRDFVTTGWTNQDGVITFVGVSDMETGDGDVSLLSDKQYTNFEIKFDWKIAPGGNSGFMWGVSEEAKYNYPYQTGQEIQILDPAIYDDPKIALGGEIEMQNAIEDLEERKHFVGALYDLSPPTDLKAAKPANEWNSYHITIDYKANRGKVVLNDILINSFPLYGPEWEAMMATSKFSRSEDFPYLGDARWYGFGKNQTGHICFQDHPGEVSFRNIKIREIE